MPAILDDAKQRIADGEAKVEEGQATIAKGMDDPVDRILEGAIPGRETNGRSKQWNKSGGLDQANKDFDKLNPGSVKPIPGGRIGVLPDGRKVNVRDHSTDGRPTLEIQDGKDKVKIRYDN